MEHGALRCHGAHGIGQPSATQRDHGGTGLVRLERGANLGAVAEFGQGGDVEIELVPSQPAHRQVRARFPYGAVEEGGKDREGRHEAGTELTRPFHELPELPVAAHTPVVLATQRMDRCEEAPASLGEGASPGRPNQQGGRLETLGLDPQLVIAGRQRRGEQHLVVRHGSAVHLLAHRGSPDEVAESVALR